TPPVFAVPFGLPPMEPLGVQVAASSASVSISWSPTTRFADGTLFTSTATPTVDELSGYSVRRSTQLCTASPVWIASNTIAVTTFTDATGGSPYFYEIRSFNTSGISTATLVVSSLGDQFFFLDDCASRLQMTDAQAGTLRGASNAWGRDIRLERRRRPQDTLGQNAIIQSAEWSPLLDGVSAIPDFRFDSPVTVFLHFLVSGGRPVPQTASVASAAPEFGAAASSPVENLGMFWNNGSEFKKMYGNVDAFGQTVTVQTPNIGRFQIRAQLRADGAVFDLSNVSSRVITPNGDGMNDVLIIAYDPGPRGVVADGAVYDLRGMRVASMTAGLVPNTIVWDGRSNGVPVTSGVYIYQIKGDGKTFNGTIVVAR
ncbi:MAG: gliding motility-associated C-terminal domain-containing protein, partial [Actinobacteria bacterium]|nr:gliding motility-associated C-terminal domain-containing protein [Actinomycetota bacterium]